MKNKEYNLEIIFFVIVCLLFIFSLVQSYMYYNHKVEVITVYLPITFEGEIPYFIDEVAIWNRTINEIENVTNDS